MAKYKFVDVGYHQDEEILKINEDIEEILNEQAMYGFRLVNIVNLEIGLFGPRKIKLIFEKEK